MDQKLVGVSCARLVRSLFVSRALFIPRSFTPRPHHGVHSPTTASTGGGHHTQPEKEIETFRDRIGRGVGRARKTIYEALDRKWKFKPRGRPQALTKKDVRV